MSAPQFVTQRINRRRFLTGLTIMAGTVAIGGCGGGTGAPTISASRLFDPRALRPDGTPQRMVWALSDVDGYLAHTAPDSITVTAVQNDITVLDAVSVDVHRDGLLVPYYPVEMEFADSSPVEFTFEASGQQFVSFVDARGRADDGLVGRNDTMPAVATPLFDDPRGSSPVCTRSPEQCPFHDISLDDALSEGRQVIINISTPAFCSNQVACGPGLEVLIAEAPEISEDVAIIHAEVYTAPTSTDLGVPAPIMDATGLWFEPALYVIERDGTVAQRLDFMWDTVDLRAAIATLS